MEGIKIRENLRQVKLKAEEIQLFKDSFVIVPYQISGFIDFTNRGATNEVVSPNDFETFKRVWTGNDACDICWKDSFKLVQNNETKKLEQHYQLGEVFLGIMETNSFDNSIEQDKSFGEYKSQEQRQTITFRVDKTFKITDYYNFMFYKIPELSGSTLYRIESIEKDFVGLDLIGYVITFKTINQELANTGRARQQNIMPSAPGQGYLECVVKDSNWPNEIGEEQFKKLVEGKDYYKIFDRYITADFQKTKNNPIRKVVVKLLGNGILSSFVMVGRAVNSEEDKVFESQSVLFGMNFNEPETPTLFRTQNNTQNFYFGEFAPTLQFYKEFFQTIKDFMGNVNEFKYAGWLGYNYNKLKATNEIKDNRYEYSLYGKLDDATLFNKPWTFNIEQKQINTQNVDGCEATYNIGGIKAIHDHLFDNFWTQKQLKTLPQNIYETLAYGKLWSSALGIGAGTAMMGNLPMAIGGFVVGSSLAIVGLLGINKNRNKAKSFTPIRGIASAPFFDYNSDLFNVTISSALPNAIPFNFLDNTNNESPNQSFFKGNTLNMCFEAEITDTFTTTRTGSKIMKTINIGQKTFENGENILESGETFLLNGDATLRKSDSYGFIIDSFKIQAIFNGEISVEFLDINGDVAWSGIYQSDGKWTDSMREIWTEKNCSVFGRDNVYFSEPIPYPKQLPKKINPFSNTIVAGDLVFKEKRYDNTKKENYVPINQAWPNDWFNRWKNANGWYESSMKVEAQFLKGEQDLSNEIKIFEYNEEINNFNAFKSIYKFLEMDFKQNTIAKEIAFAGCPNSHGYDYELNNTYSIFDRLTLNIYENKLNEFKQIELPNVLNQYLSTINELEMWSYQPFTKLEYAFIERDNQLFLQVRYSFIKQNVKHFSGDDSRKGSNDYCWGQSNSEVSPNIGFWYRPKVSDYTRGCLINFKRPTSYVNLSIYATIVMRQE